MNRREFLLLRRQPGPRSIDVVCERLYVQYLDLQLTSQPAAAADPDPTFAEPPAVFASRTAAQFFRELEEQLAPAEVIRVVNPEWLRPGSTFQSVQTTTAPPCPAGCGQPTHFLTRRQHFVFV